MTTLAEVTAELDRAARLIGVARDLLMDGKVVDLAGLDEVVTEACGGIADLPEEERQDLKPVLIALIDGLNGLVQTLNEQRDDIQGQIGGLDARSKATSAYGKGAAAGKPGRGS